MKRTIAVSLLLTAVTISWSALLFTAGPWASDAAAVIAAGSIALAAIGVTGMLVASSRWGRWLSVIVAFAMPALAVSLPISAWWIANLVASAMVVSSLAGTATSGVIRKLPRADGPTPRVVAFMLVLAGLPPVVAVVSPGGLGIPEWMMITVSIVAAIAYAKATTLSIVAVRLGYTVVALVASILAGWPRGVIWIVIGSTVTALAWQRDVRLAVRPLAQRGRAVPILPEMVPPDILEAAGLDERGRPKEPDS